MNETTQELKYDRQFVGQVTLVQPERFTAERAVDGVRLALPVRVRLESVTYSPTSAVPEPLTAALILTALEAEVRWRGLFLGVARGTQAYRSNPTDIQGAIHLHIPAASVWCIENGRNGDHVPFDLRLRGCLHVEVPLPNLAAGSPNEPYQEIVGPSDYLSPPREFVGNHNVSYSESAWVDMLHKTGLGENVTVEIPLPPTPSDPRWKAVWQSLRVARDALTRGGSAGWREVVTESRVALEKWREIESIELGPNNARDRTPQQRLDKIREALHEYAHLGPHETAERWARADAVVVLAGLASLLAQRGP